MKVMFVAVFSPTSTNNSQSNGLMNAGCTVIEYNYREKARDLGSTARDSDIIAVCYKTQPDLVLFSKCNEVDYRVINDCNRWTKTALWYMDPMSNFNQELIEKIKCCTYTFCALTEPYKAAQRYSKSVHFLQEGFDHIVNLPVNVPYKHNISFIGSLRGIRQHYHDRYHFHNYTNVFGHQHSVAVSETKINLNFTEGGTSDRTYKVLASRGFLLTQPWDGMEEDFIDGKDLVTFRDTKEYEEKVIYYLNNEDERLAIAENGYKKVQKFNRDNWAVRLLEVING